MLAGWTCIEPDLATRTLLSDTGTGPDGMSTFHRSVTGGPNGAVLDGSAVKLTSRASISASGGSGSDPPSPPMGRRELSLVAMMVLLFVGSVPHGPLDTREACHRPVHVVARAPRPQTPT